MRAIRYIHKTKALSILLGERIWYLHALGALNSAFSCCCMYNGPNVGVEDGACEYMTYLTVHENHVR